MQEQEIKIKNFVDPDENADILRIQIPLSELEEIKKHCIRKAMKNGGKLNCKKCRYRSKIEIDACMFADCPIDWR